MRRIMHDARTEYLGVSPRDYAPTADEVIVRSSEFVSRLRFLWRARGVLILSSENLTFVPYRGGGDAISMSLDELTDEQILGIGALASPEIGLPGRTIYLRWRGRGLKFVVREPRLWIDDIRTARAALDQRASSGS
jgi:hypothetical protein